MSQETYLKNELKSYNDLRKKIIENESYYDRRINYYHTRLKEIEVEINSGNGKGIDYSYTPGTRSSESILNLLAQEENVKTQLKYYENLKDVELKSYRMRLDMMDDMLSKLSDEEQKFIRMYYIEHIPIQELEMKLNYSRTKLFNDKDKIINKMLKYT